jgi:stage IV sporulation protein B
LQYAKQLLRGVAALVLALLLCVQTPAMAADVNGEEPRMLVPVGHTVGVKLFARGVVVVKLSEGGTPAKACGLRTGDIILKCGGITVTSTEQFQSLLRESGGTATELQVTRDGGSVTLSVCPKQNSEGDYCIGAWIRDSMAGIGTMTYYDPATGVFGALGHGITDVDTTQLMPFANGSILPSTVKAVKRGETGTAGELRGNFDLTENLGGLYANTTSGVFGTLETMSDELPLGEAVPVGQAAAGPAVIWSNVQGDTVEEYDIEILKVVSNASDSRDMVICVTDPDLIAITGGIVQGMSGSPILQDGKLVGAVTHVLLNDPTKGYGILIQNMLDASGNGAA